MSRVRPVYSPRPESGVAAPPRFKRTRGSTASAPPVQGRQARSTLLLRNLLGSPEGQPTLSERKLCFEKYKKCGQASQMSNTAEPRPKLIRHLSNTGFLHGFNADFELGEERVERGAQCAPSFAMPQMVPDLKFQFTMFYSAKQNRHKAR